MHAQRSIGTSAKLRNAEEVFEDDPDTTQEPGKDTTGVVDGVIGSLGELDKEELGKSLDTVILAGFGGRQRESHYVPFGMIRHRCIRVSQRPRRRRRAC